MPAVALGRIPVPAAILRDGRLVAANAPFAELFGYSSGEEAVAVGLDGLFRDPQRLRVLAAEAGRVAELRALHCTGRPFAVRAELSALRAGQRWLSLTDISAETSARDRFSAVMEGSLQGVLVHRDMKPLYANDAYARICGYDSAADILGMENILEMTAPEDQPIVLGNYLARMRGEPAPTRYRHRLRRRDGRVIWLDNEVRVVDWEGRPAVQVTNVDVSEYRETPEEGESHFSRTLELAASMAEPFRRHYERLAALLGVARAEAGPEGHAVAVPHLQALNDALARLRSDLERLLVPAQCEGTALQPVELNGLVQDVLQGRLEPRAVPELSSHRLHYRTDLDPGVSPVQGNPLQLRQVLALLYDNAAEAMPRGGTITTRTRLVGPGKHGADPEAPCVQLVVEDDGPGVAGYLGERVFEPFVTAKEGHPGLGLTAARAVLEACGAEITLLPGGERGTQVCICFPLQRRSA